MTAAQKMKDTDKVNAELMDYRFNNIEKMLAEIRAEFNSQYNDLSHKLEEKFVSQDQLRNKLAPFEQSTRVVYYTIGLIGTSFLIAVVNFFIGKK